jgi:hypothetical protein
VLMQSWSGTAAPGCAEEDIFAEPPCRTDMSFEKVHLDCSRCLPLQSNECSV